MAVTLFYGLVISSAVRCRSCKFFDNSHEGTMESLYKDPRRWHGRWLGLLFFYAALMGWHVLTARSASATVMAGMLVAVLVAFFLGDLLLKLLLKDKDAFDTLSFRLLSGVLTGLALLYAAALALPFGLPIDAALIAGAVIATWIVVRKGRRSQSFSGGHPSESTVIALGLLAVTLWCRDLLQPIDTSQFSVVIPAWHDVFYQLSQIAAFSGSAGAGTIHDVQMAGSVPHPYHFASFVFPALLVSGAQVSTWTAYASFLVPVGIVLTFLAAHAIAAPVFGVWPASAGALALLLLPDAWQQGFGNPFMAYHWLQQIAPAGAYGVASAALSFLLMIEACRSRRIGLMLASYAFLFATLIFKAQIFVAIAFPLLVFPALFYVGLSIVQRLAIMSILIPIFVGVVRLSQQISSVPVMRMDGSSLAHFSHKVLKVQNKGSVEFVFSQFFAVTSVKGFVFGIMLLFITFGIFPFIYGYQLRRLQRTFEPMVWLFPILVVATFVVMATGMAVDDRRLGMPEELLHRPLVWAYFIVVVWTMSAAYRLIFGDAPPDKGHPFTWGVCILFLMFNVPGDYGSRIQTMTAWKQDFPRLSGCHVRAALFIKENSLPGDIVQDTGNDPKFILTAFSSRAPFAIDAGGGRPPKGLAQRLQTLEAVRSAASKDQASALARQLGIQWWVLGPSTTVAWQTDTSRKAAFTCDDYQVFRF
jgi:hypothetical protein